MGAVGVEKRTFDLADRRHCRPLTITDLAGDYLLACEALFEGGSLDIGGTWAR